MLQRDDRDEVDELAATVHEAAPRLARRAVREVELHLLDDEAAARGIDRHADLHPESFAERRDGAPAGLAALAEVDENVPRREAVAAYLHEKNGDLELAARLYADAARNAPNLAERDHQTMQAARLNHQLQERR